MAFVRTWCTCNSTGCPAKRDIAAFPVPRFFRAFGSDSDVSCSIQVTPDRQHSVPRSGSRGSGISSQEVDPLRNPWHLELRPRGRLQVLAVVSTENTGPRWTVGCQPRVCIRMDIRGGLGGRQRGRQAGRRPECERNPFSMSQVWLLTTASPRVDSPLPLGSCGSGSCHVIWNIAAGRGGEGDSRDRVMLPRENSKPWADLGWRCAVTVIVSTGSETFQEFRRKNLKVTATVAKKGRDDTFTLQDTWMWKERGVVCVGKFGG